MRIDAQGSRQGTLLLESRDPEDGSGNVHARFTLAEPIEVPEHLGFVVADIGVNARSCLDMAVHQISEFYQTGIRAPQFPLEDDIDKPLSKRTRDLLRDLPDAFGSVIRSLQPSYVSPWGRTDVPVNVAALMIRAVSNSNKHRNLTPVMRAANSWGFAGGDDLEVELVMPEDSLWNDDDATILELRHKKDAVSEARLLALKPMMGLRLQIHSSGFGYDWMPGYPMPLNVSDFLSRTSEYVYHALKVFSQAHEYTQNPIGEFRFDRNLMD